MASITLQGQPCFSDDVPESEEGNSDDSGDDSGDDTSSSGGDDSVW